MTDRQEELYTLADRFLSNSGLYYPLYVVNDAGLNLPLREVLVNFFQAAELLVPPEVKRG